MENVYNFHIKEKFKRELRRFYKKSQKQSRENASEPIHKRLMIQCEEIKIIEK